MSCQLLVLYHSRTGHTQQMALWLAQGARQANAEVVLRCVTHDGEHQRVALDDLIRADALAVGCPTRFGHMAAAMQQFWETTSDLWLRGDLIGKPAGVFTSTGSLHGGQEATLLQLALPLLHHGMLLSGLPYAHAELHTTESGGTPYGPSHTSGLQGEKPLTASETRLCQALGARLARLGQQLRASHDHD